jgi:hypothetical protein
VGQEPAVDVALKLLAPSGLRGGAWRRRLGVLLALCTVTSASVAQQQPGVSFGLLSLVEGQSLRLHALNLGNRSSTPATGCNVTLRFLGTSGRVQREDTVRLSAGQGAWLDLRRAQVSEPAGRTSVRAVLLFGLAGGGAPPGPEVRQHFDCNIVPTLELIDDSSGRTILVLSETRPNPLPDARAPGSTP